MSEHFTGKGEPRKFPLSNNEPLLSLDGRYDVLRRRTQAFMYVFLTASRIPSSLHTPKVCCLLSSPRFQVNAIQKSCRFGDLSGLKFRAVPR
ncbi:hypothetical protein AVEN_90796-1 [Araneus ventricosus]|uniref:Uncharacterized protein n=1 Tax=Araneus ventricosus TaxID=182803 RepID=A0A4Y2NFQ3_ARAVE|nr:hypothetical protein AVEN_90796-1 [Araneus ventricosus]